MRFEIGHEVQLAYPALHRCFGSNPMGPEEQHRLVELASDPQLVFGSGS
jgi:hypothetical protein